VPVTRTGLPFESSLTSEPELSSSEVEASFAPSWTNGRAPWRRSGMRRSAPQDLDGPLLSADRLRIDRPQIVLQKLQMDRYRFDDLIEYVLTRRGRENLALATIAVGCVAGIVYIGRS
jgi:hypothetical protein